MTTETITADEFTIQLRMFDAIIEGYPEPSKVQSKLEKLKEKAANSNELTFWQKDAIIARANNYLKGEYGEQVKKTDYRSDYSKTLK